MKRTILLIILSFSVGVNIYLYSRLQQVGISILGKTAIPDSEKWNSVNSSYQYPQQYSLDMDTANNLFQQQLFTEATIVLNQLAAINPAAAEHVKQQWYDQLMQWLAQQQYTLIEAFNNAYLIHFSNDADFLMIRAERLAATGFLLESIYQYYSLITFLDGHKNEIIFLKRVHQIADQQIIRLKQQTAWQALIDFIQPILHKEPDYPPYILALAEAQIKLNLLQEAEQYLLPLLHEDFYANHAADLLNHIQLKDLEEKPVQLKPYGEHYLVNGLINTDQKVTLLIDTGASLSTLSQNSFTKLLNVYTPDFVTEATIHTAGGEVYAPIYRFQYFQIDNYQLRNMEFAILQFTDIPGADGLLGMNFLRNFQFSIDQQNNVLKLMPN